MVGYWLILAVAVVTEILWALSLKYIQQHPGPWPVAASLGLTLVNMALLSLAMRGIPAGVAYAVWTGIGAVVTVIYAALSGAEALTPLKALFLVGIIGCVVGLKKTSDGDEPGPAGD